MCSPFFLISILGNGAVLTKDFLLTKWAGTQVNPGWSSGTEMFWYYRLKAASHMTLGGNFLKSLKQHEICIMFWSFYDCFEKSWTMMNCRKAKYHFFFGFAVLQRHHEGCQLIEKSEDFSNLPRKHCSSSCCREPQKNTKHSWLMNSSWQCSELFGLCWLCFENTFNVTWHQLISNRPSWILCLICVNLNLNSFSKF